MTPADDSKNPTLNIDPLKIVDTRCCSGIQTNKETRLWSFIVGNGTTEVFGRRLTFKTEMQLTDH